MILVVALKKMAVDIVSRGDGVVLTSGDRVMVTSDDSMVVTKADIVMVNHDSYILTIVPVIVNW